MRIVVASVFWMGLMVGCGTKDEPKPGTGGDADADSDVDADADADSDADADADADADDTAAPDDTGTPAPSASPTEGHSWCASGGISTSGITTHVGCLSPLDISAGTTATDGTHTVHTGPLRRISP